MHEYGHAVQDAQVPGYGTRWTPARSARRSATTSRCRSGCGRPARTAGRSRRPPACVVDWDADVVHRVDGDRALPAPGRQEHHGGATSQARCTTTGRSGRGRCGTSATASSDPRYRRDRIIIEAQFAFDPGTSFAAAAQDTLDAAHEALRLPVRRHHHQGVQGPRHPLTHLRVGRFGGVTRAPEAVELVNDVVRLVPGHHRDAAGLFAALDDERVWAAGYGGGPAGRWRDVEAARAALARSTGGRPAPRQAYVVRLATDSDLGAAGTVVGTTSLGDWDLVNERAHIGWTAYGPPWWAAGQPGVQAAPARPRLRRLRLRPGEAADRPDQQPVAGGDRQARRDPRGRAAPARAAGRRDVPGPVVYSILRDEWPGRRSRARLAVA